MHRIVQRRGGMVLAVWNGQKWHFAVHAGWVNGVETIIDHRLWHLVQSRTFEDFARGRQVIVVPLEGHRPYEEVFQAAWEVLKSPPEYNLWDSNCEHFATGCATGEPRSRQAERAKKAIGEAAAFIACATLGLGVLKAILD